MPLRVTPLVIGEIYHVLNRGVNHQPIFIDKWDYKRLLEIIFFYQFVKPPIRFSYYDRLPLGDKENLLREIQQKYPKLVNVFAFCFMPNHIHLLLKQVKLNGISKFMQKATGGYAKYFNKKYKRNGHVFQNEFKSVYVKKDNQFMATVSYIFTNPIALIEPGWKELGIRTHSVKEIIKFLEDYKWSSYQDCIGIKNFPSVTQRDFLLETMSGVDGLKEVVKDWINHKIDISKYNNLFLE